MVSPERESVTSKTILAGSPGLSESKAAGPAAVADPIFMAFDAVRHAAKAISNASAVQAMIQADCSSKGKQSWQARQVSPASNVQAVPGYRVKK